MYKKKQIKLIFMYQFYFSPPILSLSYKSLNFLLLSNIFNENMSVCQSCLLSVHRYIIINHLNIYTGCQNNMFTISVYPIKTIIII